MGIGAKLQQLLDEKGKKPGTLASETGISKNTIYAIIKRDNKKVDMAILDTIANNLGVSIDRFFEGENESAAPRPALPDAIPYTPMPLVRVAGAVRCGPGGLAIEEDLGYERADVPSPKDYIYLRATGDSMAPQICEGDLALVHLQPDVESGELAVVVIDGEEGMLKRVIKREGALILQSFNASVEPRIVVGEALNDVMIVGKVVQTVRKW